MHARGALPSLEICFVAQRRLQVASAADAVVQDLRLPPHWTTRRLSNRRSEIVDARGALLLSLEICSVAQRRLQVASAADAVVQDLRLPPHRTTRRLSNRRSEIVHARGALPSLEICFVAQRRLQVASAADAVVQDLGLPTHRTTRRLSNRRSEIVHARGAPPSLEICSVAQRRLQVASAADAVVQDLGLPTHRTTRRLSNRRSEIVHARGALPSLEICSVAQRRLQVASAADAVVQDLGLPTHRTTRRLSNRRSEIVDARGALPSLEICSVAQRRLQVASAADAVAEDLRLPTHWTTRRLSNRQDDIVRASWKDPGQVATRPRHQQAQTSEAQGVERIISCDGDSEK